MGDGLDRRIEVCHEACEVGPAGQRNALLDALLVVCELHATLLPVEERRRDRQVPVPGELVGHAADVRGHAEHFLHDDDCAATHGRVCRAGKVGGEIVAVGGAKIEVHADSITPSRRASRKRGACKDNRPPRRAYEPTRGSRYARLPAPCALAGDRRMYVARAAAPRRVAIVGAARIPFARSLGAYAECSNQEMLTAALQALVDRCGLAGARLGDVGAGAVLKHTRDYNLTRESVLGTALDPHTPAFDLQRACGTSLETAIVLGLKIAAGQIESAIAAGVDTASDAPIGVSEPLRRILLRSARGRTLGRRLAPWTGLRPRHLRPQVPAVLEPRTGLTMGQSCELMAQRWGIARSAQDELALASHQHAAAAYEAGFFADLVHEFQGLRHDDNLRRDTSLEKLARLRPAFPMNGSATLTAGNSTPLTDGAAAVLLASEEWARERGLPVLAYLTCGRVAAVDFVAGEGLLMAPAFAVARMLEDAGGLALQDFDFYEIHEAFAAQVLCTLQAWESPEYCRERLGLERPLGAIDRARLNVTGSSLALGHPFAATGARILGTLAKLLDRRGGGRGLISICTAGGMGVTAIVER